MKKLIFFIFALLSFAKSYADEGDRLFIYLKSGDIVVVDFAEATKTTFENGIVTVGNERYQFTNISKFTFGRNGTGINGTEDDGSELQIDDHQIVVKQKKRDQTVALYTVDGKRVAADVKKAGDSVTVDLEALPVGVYLLKVGSETIKFRKR